MIPRQLHFRELKKNQPTWMLSVSSWLAKTNTNVMSRASKVVLGVSVVLTLSTVTIVHLKQTWDRQVGLSEATAVIKTEQAACWLDSSVPLVRVRSRSETSLIWRAHP